MKQAHPLSVSNAVDPVLLLALLSIFDVRREIRRILSASNSLERVAGFEKRELIARVS
jgi:hypothetical protein